MKTYYANIAVINSFCYVCDYDPYQYHVKNVSGLQYCFKGHIYSDQCGNYQNKFDVGSMFPISLFFGIKEGIKLNYHILIQYILHSINLKLNLMSIS